MRSFVVLLSQWHGVCSSSTERNKMLSVNPKLAYLTFRRTTMKTLMIKDLSLTEHLDRKADR